MKSEQETSKELRILLEEIGSTSAINFIDIFNYGSTLFNRFGLQFHYRAPWGKLLDPFAPDIIIFKCAKREEFWKFCSDKIESIYRFVSTISPQSGFKYLNDSNLIVAIQTTTTDMYSLKEVLHSPLSYLRYTKTCQYSWLTITHLASENGLEYCELTKLKPLVFQALSFLRQYFFSDADVVREALAPSLEPVVVFVYRTVSLGIFNSVMLEDASIDLMKKCLSLDNNQIGTIFRILVTIEILNKLAAQNVLILDANGVTDRVVNLLDVLMEILENGESSNYWIFTIDSIFITACQYLNMAMSNGLMQTMISRINKIMTDYLEHTFSQNLFFKRPVNSVISLYTNCLLADEQLDLKMIFHSIDALEMKMTEYNSYFCGTYDHSTQTTCPLSFGENRHEIEKMDLSYSEEDDLQTDREDNCILDRVDENTYSSSVFDEHYDKTEENTNSYREDTQIDREDNCILDRVSHDSYSSSVFDGNYHETDEIDNYREDNNVCKRIKFDDMIKTDPEDNCILDRLDENAYSPSVFDENYDKREENAYSYREDTQIDREDNCIPDRVYHDAYSSSVFYGTYHETDEIGNCREDNNVCEQVKLDDMIKTDHGDNCILDRVDEKAYSSYVFDENCDKREENASSYREDTQIDFEGNCIPDRVSHDAYSSPVFDGTYHETDEIEYYREDNNVCEQVKLDDMIETNREDNCIADRVDENAYSSSVFDENDDITEKDANSYREDTQIDFEGNCIPDRVSHDAFSSAVFDGTYHETDENEHYREDNNVCEQVKLDDMIETDREDICIADRVDENAYSSSVFDKNDDKTEKDVNSYREDTQIDFEGNCIPDRVSNDAYSSPVFDGTNHETDEVEYYREDNTVCEQVKLDDMIKTDREDNCILDRVDENAYSSSVFDDNNDKTEENANSYREDTQDDLDFCDEVLTRRGLEYKNKPQKELDE